MIEHAHSTTQSSVSALTKLNGGTFREQNISGFYVTMNKSTAVKILQTTQSFIADCTDLLLPQWLLVN